MVNAVPPLCRRRCTSCEIGAQRVSPVQARALLKLVDGWRIVDGGKAIRREWRVHNFAAALAFFNRVGSIAEREGHHPDLHLAGYRNVVIELTTHDAGGLTENDFILAAKIDRVKVRLKKD